MSSSLVSVYKINMITTKRNPVVGDKITCYYWHISCVACRSVCNGQSEMSVEPLNGGGGNIGWGAVWGESNSKSALSICLAWNQILLQKVAPLANLAFPPTIACSCCTWVDFALFWHWCSVAAAFVCFCRVTEWKLRRVCKFRLLAIVVCFGNAFQFAAQLEFPPPSSLPPCGLLEAAQEFPPFAPPWHTQVLAIAHICHNRHNRRWCIFS